MLINSIYNIVNQIFIGQGVGYLGNGALLADKLWIKFYDKDLVTMVSKEADKVNKQRAKHYKYYTNQEWGKTEKNGLHLLDTYITVLNVHKILN